jgi:O-6-methylguanine DNA methyltransferase
VKVIEVYVKQVDGKWYGLAYEAESILATIVSSTEEMAARELVGIIPSDVEHRVVGEGSEFAERTVSMLKELESGNEEFKSFSLAIEYMSEPVAKVLKAAASIPVGYVTSYGNLAKIADTEPQTVGRIMAANPLYPIVPCHRVVGADFSLVGYGGGRKPSALQAKLERLEQEAKGFAA